MGLDLENSYQQAKDKIKSFKTFNEVKSTIKNASQSTPGQLQPSISGTRFQIDQAALQNRIKQQVQGQFEQLIGLLLSNKGSGTSTVTFLIQKFIRTIKILKSKLLDIIVEEFVRALGCDLEQTFLAGQYYIKVSSIDLFKMFEIEPDTKIGKMFYEPLLYDPFAIPRSTNRMFYSLTQSPDSAHSSFAQYNQFYLGFSTIPLFDIYFTQYDPSGDGSGWFVVNVLDRADGTPNKVTQFLYDYLKTINIIDIKALIAALVEAVLGVISVKVRWGEKTIDDTTRFGLLVQRILGLCFDEDQEISVGGQAKTPVLDDTTDSFFDITDLERGQIEERTLQIQKGVITFESCDNIELPIDADQIIDIIDETIGLNEDIDSMENALEQISVSLSNDPRWQASFPFPDQIKLTLDFNFVKKIPQAVISNVLSPKVIFPFILMMKATGQFYDDNLTGLSNFIRQNSQLMKNIMSRIGAAFVETLFKEIKKDVRNLVRSIIIDISKDENGVIYLMLEKLINLGISISIVINDYRKCKSVIDSILQLLNLIPKINLQLIPTPLLQLAAFLPGYSPNRAFINSIEEMQKLGLPTGPMPDGSPNLMAQFAYAIMVAQDKEHKENGKVLAALKLPPPFGLIRASGKSV
jgi:hypothetical protein